MHKSEAVKLIASDCHGHRLIG